MISLTIEGLRSLIQYYESQGVPEDEVEPIRELLAKMEERESD